MLMYYNVEYVLRCAAVARFVGRSLRRYQFYTIRYVYVAVLLWYV